jgi:hypothetical protein
VNESHTSAGSSQANGNPQAECRPGHTPIPARQRSRTDACCHAVRMIVSNSARVGPSVSNVVFTSWDAV